MKKIFQLFALLFVASLLFIKCDAMGPPPAIYATDVTLNVSSLQFAPGDTETLIATVTPGDATHRHLTWASSNTDVATVNASGVVTAVANGTATITVTVQGAYRATAVVTVSTALEGISLNVETVRLLSIGAYQTLTVRFTPATASNQNVTWTSSHPAVASVENGLVTALTSGTTTITVRSEEGGFEATSVVRVEDWVAIPLTAAMLSTNAPQGGAGIERLLDGDPATYFHTSWGGIPAPHYFVVNLGTPLSGTISYSYRTRGGGHTTVRSMRVEASNDGTNWTNVSEQDFPFPAQNLRLIAAESFTLPGAFSMFRFTPLSTVNHHPNMPPAGYFCMREFNLFRVQ